jgi:hypothetical protein
MDTFWREFARQRLSPSTFAEADRRQREYDAAIAGQQHAPGPGIIQGLLAGFHATRWGNRYWQESHMIDQVMSRHRANDVGHPPGCTCRFCFRGFIDNGFGR